MRRIHPAAPGADERSSAAPVPDGLRARLHRRATTKTRWAYRKLLVQRVSLVGSLKPGAVPVTMRAKPGVSRRFSAADALRRFTRV